MGNSWFQFQKFRVNQDRCAMKISTDAVLMGSLSKAENPSKILDIGTGTGVIALMLAQRYEFANITAIEIDADAAGQAMENFKESPFSSRLKLIHGPLQEFLPVEKFDLIVSNPPFFPEHLKSADPKRNKALHTGELSFEDLVESVCKLLSKTGTFWVILPPRQMLSLEEIASKYGLFIHSKIRVKDAEIKPIHREISEFTYQKVVSKEEDLILKDENSAYTRSYTALLSGFLLGY